MDGDAGSLKFSQSHSLSDAAASRTGTSGKKTLHDIELEDLTEAEKELKEADWSAFKGDVSMKDLIVALDKGIKRRMRLWIFDDPAETERVARFRAFYMKAKPIKMIAIFLYMALPFFEKPGWCLTNPKINSDTTEGFWYCQN